jgi:lipopolysaccharide biosynthesis glycosyltransferase
MIHLFSGSDPREIIGLSVFCHSVWSKASKPVSITPIGAVTPSDGTNAFTKSRFLVPEIMGFEGMAIFADGSDMLCRADIAELAALFDKQYAVQVVKHDYKTKFPTKYLGQPNLDYPRKNWSSLMLINCGHWSWKKIHAGTIGQMTGQYLHRFEFLRDDDIGELPKEWNHLVEEQEYNKNAKIAHFSIGIPVWYPDHGYSAEWFSMAHQMSQFQPWVSER